MKSRATLLTIRLAQTRRAENVPAPRSEINHSRPFRYMSLDYRQAVLMKATCGADLKVFIFKHLVILKK